MLSAEAYVSYIDYIYSTMRSLPWFLCNIEVVHDNGLLFAQISKATEDISVPAAIRRQQIDLSTVLIALDIYSYLFIYFKAMNVHFIRNLTIFYSP